MNNCFKLLLISVFLLLTPGCSNQDQEAVNELVLPDFEQLVQNGYIEPYKTGDIDRWLEIFADDVVGMHNTLPPMEGKQALRQFAETVHSIFDIEQLDVTVDSVTSSGDWVLTRGIFVTNFVPKGGDGEERSEPRQGKYILLWERQSDNTWKIILDMGNNNKP